MFLNKLTEKQQIVFYRAAQMLVGSDGRYDRREAHFLENAKRELSLGETPLAAASVEEVVADLGIFDRNVARNILVFELVGLAMADANVQPAEQDVLEAICKELEIPEARIEQYRDFAIRSRELRDEAYYLISEE